MSGRFQEKEQILLVVRDNWILKSYFRNVKTELSSRVINFNQTSVASANQVYSDFVIFFFKFGRLERKGMFPN